MENHGTEAFPLYLYPPTITDAGGTWKQSGFVLTAYQAISANPHG